MKLKVKNKVTNVSLIIFLCLVLVFVESWAVRMPTRPYGTDEQRAFLNNLVRVCAFLALILSANIKKIGYIGITFIASDLLGHILSILYAYHYEGIGLTSFILAVVYCSQPDEIRAKIFRYFKYIVVASAVVGIICYISYYLPFGIGIPYKVLDISDPTVKIIDYKVCYFTYFSSYHMLRFNGFFEEPGWFGTWAAFYLCADDFNLKKKENIVIFVSGCMTFSLAFFILIIIYFVLRIISNIKLWPLLMILAMTYLFILPNVRTGNEAIDHVLQRMVITEDGLAGDNRNGDVFEELYQRTIHSGDVFFGHGANYAESYLESVNASEGLASIKSYIVNYGIIGTAALYLPLLIASLNYAIKSKNRTMVFYIIISYASLYQRPYLFWSPYLNVFICGLSYIKQSRINCAKNSSDGQLTRQCKTMVARQDALQT